MNKKFTLWQTKKWITPYLICTIILAAIFISGMSFMDVGVYTNTASGNLRVGTGSAYLEDLAYPALIMSVIPPFLVYSDRTSRTKTDTYRQTPFTKRGYRAHKLIIALVMYLISVTIAFLLGMLVFGIKVASFEVTDSQYVYTFYTGYYFLAWIVILAECACAYFVNCFFVSLGSNRISQVIFLICASYFLSQIMYGAVTYYYTVTLNLIETDNLSLSQFQCFNWLADVFDSLILTNCVPEIDCYTNFVVSMVLYHVIAAGLGFLCFFLKEPSGEKAGRGGYSNFACRFIVPATFCLLYMELLLTISFSALDILYILLLLVAHYVLLLLIDKSAKLDKPDIIINLSDIGVVLLLVGMVFVLRAIVNAFDAVPADSLEIVSELLR